MKPIDLKYVIGVTVCAIPLLDRVFGAPGQYYHIADITIMCVALFLMPYVASVKKSTMVWILIFMFFAFTTLLGGTTVTVLSVRQFLSLLLAGVYVFSIITIARKTGVAFLMKWIVIISMVNSVFTILIGIFPNILQSLVFEISEHGRSLGGEKLPFVRNIGFFNHYGYGAAFLLLALGSTLFLSAGRIGRREVLVFIVILSSFVVTQSRAIWIAALLLISLMILFLPDLQGAQYRRIVWLRKALFILLAFASLPIMNVAFDLLVAMKSATFYNRIAAIFVGLDLFATNPLLGAGYGAYFAIEESGAALHNMYITVLYSTGLMGIIPFVLLMFLPLYKLHRKSFRAWGMITFLPILLVLSASSGLSFYSLWLAIGCVIAVGEAVAEAPPDVTLSSFGKSR